VRSSRAWSSTSSLDASGDLQPLIALTTTVVRAKELSARRDGSEGRFIDITFDGSEGFIAKTPSGRAVEKSEVLLTHTPTKSLGFAP
jgi:hypothetical protein